MRSRIYSISSSIGMLALGLAASRVAEARVYVVASMPEYAWAAQAIGGDLVEATTICPPDQDAHFLTPRPSYAVKLSKADLFIATGLDLELWAPVLLQKSGNRKVTPGSPGYVNASQGVRLLDKPASVDRSQGDVHIYGNPHIHTSPLNMRIVIRNVARGLVRIDPSNAPAYRKGADRAIRDLDVRTFGQALVDALGGDTLARLAVKGKLFGFLEGRKFRKKPLIAQLGGWLGKLRKHQGTKIVTYHTNWSYLADLFGLEIATVIELKPGVPPSARHVKEVLRIVKEQKIPLLLAVNYYPKGHIESVANRARMTALIEPFHLGALGTKSYPDLVDHWVAALHSVLEASR